MPSNHAFCTEVSAECPVSATTLGYYPNLGANVFFVVVYALCAIFTLGIGLWKKTYVFGVVVFAGFALETCGQYLHLGGDLRYFLWNKYRLTRCRIYRSNPDAFQPMVRPGL